MHPKFNDVLKVPTVDDITSAKERSEAVRQLCIALERHTVSRHDVEVALIHDPAEIPKWRPISTQEPNEVSGITFDRENRVIWLDPEQMLMLAMRKALNDYNTEVADIIQSRIAALDELKFLTRYTVDVMQAEWRDYRITIEAEDEEDLQNKINDLSCVEDADDWNDQSSSSFHMEFPSRYEGVHISGEIEDCIVERRLVE